MRGRTGRDLLLCIIRVMECGWGWEAVINLSKMMDYTNGLYLRSLILILLMSQHRSSRTKSNRNALNAAENSLDVCERQLQRCFFH